MKRCNAHKTRSRETERNRYRDVMGKEKKDGFGEEKGVLESENDNNCENAIRLSILGRREYVRGKRGRAG